MSMLQESRAIGMAALRLPHALRRRGCGTVHYVAERNDRYPVLLAPGRCARIMHPGPRSELPGADAPRPVRWLAYHSGADRGVPSASARLDDRRVQAPH